MFFRRFAVKLIFSLVFIQFLSVIDCNKPKLSVITGQTSRLNDQTTVVDIETNSTLRMTCEGTEPIRWRFPENDPYSPPISRVSRVDSKCSKNGVCQSDLILPNTRYWQTGLYSCFYNQSIDSKDSIYVFINDQDNLMVPVDGIEDSIVVTVYDSNGSDFLIPCRPTDSRAVVSLRMFDTQNDSYIEIPNLWMTFDPTIGFKVNKIKTQNYINYECKVELEDRDQYSFVTILKSSQTKLYPSINVVPNVTRVGDDITLHCAVNTAVNNFVDILWHFPSRFDRKSESSPEAVTKQSSEGVFQTVSRSLTIFNATDNDSGVYSCNVTDIRGQTYSVSKSLLIRHYSSRSCSIYSGPLSQLSFKTYCLIHFITILVLNQLF